MGKGATDWKAIIAFGLIIGVLTGYIKLDALTGGIGGGDVTVNTNLVTLPVKGIDALAGSAGGMNAESWDLSNNEIDGETSVASATTSLGTDYPNTFSGYVLMGNDNYVSTSDRGTEYYYVKEDVSWVDKQGTLPVYQINSYAEETGTGTTIWEFYDQNSLETTANITIGSGGTYTSAAVKIKSQSNLCIGNPTLDGYNGKKSVAWCFNESTAGMFKEIKPQKNSGFAPMPGFLKGQNVVECYYTHDSKCDGAYWETDLFVEANAGKNPASGTDYIGIIPIDLCWYHNDLLKPAVGFGDESDLAADTDCGIDSRAAWLQVHNA